MYSAHEILASVDANKTMFMTISACALIFNYVFFISAILNGRNDRVYPFPLICCTIWFAHDISYLLKYDEWFHVYNHWYLTSFWYGLIPTSIIEAIYIYQVWLYGKDELLPGASRGAFTIYVLAAMVAGAIGWASVKYFLDDPIYAYTFGSTGYLAVVFNAARLLARGDAGGQSVTMWVAYIGMQSCWFLTTILLFGPAFRSETWLILWLACIVGGGFMAAASYKLKSQHRLARSGPMASLA